MIASVWTLAALSKLSGLVTDTVRDSESVTAVTSKLSGALEREDDAVLLVLAGDARGMTVLSQERTVVDKAVADLFDVLGPADEQELAKPLESELQAYRRAADALAAVAPEREALVHYHQKANPLLRRAVALTTVIRDRHFELARRTVTGAKDEATASRSAVLVITLAALTFAVVVAWHLSSRNVYLTPEQRESALVLNRSLRATESMFAQGERSANAIREGRFDERFEISSRDELGELASVFNQMTADLAEFRRTNVGEVVRAKNTLESTLEALPDAVVLLDADCRILSMNGAALRAFDAAGVRNPTGLEDLQVDGLDRVTIAEAIRTGANAAPVTDLARTIAVERDGTMKRLLPRVVPVPGLTPQQSGAILLLYDVTDLVRLDEMRSELVAVASHELQTPLTTLRMTLLMLKEAAGALPARERELVDTSLIGVEQLSETVHEFLDLTRIEAGELRLNVEPVHLSALFTEVARRAEPQANAQGVHIRSMVDAGLPSVWGDQRRLRVVLDNIVSNALKYTPTGGTVTLEAHRAVRHESGPSDRVTISVSDTGPGVPSAFRDRVFEKFFRLERQQPEDRSHARGAGIGLYMCRQIVELHGGHIECRAASDERGARFTVELPVDGSVAIPVVSEYLG